MLGIYYEYIKIKNTSCKKDKIKDSQNIKTLDDIDYEISSNLLNRKHELIGDYIEFKIEKYKNIFSYIKEDTESSVRRRVELKSKIEKMEEMLRCL